jgi:crotonobetainyl-CoA:carnitine CoA-transferase CaiB-like acyl-CoA transferase
MVRHFTDQVIPQRQGSLHWNHFTHILPCRDGWIQLTLLEHWDTLVSWLDSEGMAADLTQPQWKAPQYRQAHADHIIAVIAGWTRTHTTEELFETAQLMQLPWAPVADPKTVLSSPQLKARRFFRIPDGPQTGNPIKYPGLPFRCTPPMAAPLQAAPGVGQHNAKIYGKELGLSDEMLKDLTARGIL